MTILLPFLFVLSGAAGLIYEVVWARELVLVFGNTSQAVSTILTGFFGGLAVGSFYGGRTADRVRRPLRMYAVLELILVALVLLTPISFRLLGDIYRGFYPALSETPLALALVRFMLAIIALAPATILMGATLPTLTRYLAARMDGLAGAFTRLYAANTIGAIVGTFVAGFVLIEALGLQGALLIGAICSGSAGLIALVLDRRVGPVATTKQSQVEPLPDRGRVSRDPQQAVRAARQLALLLAFASGLTSLGYQVVWNRLLAAGTGNSTYVFTVILTLFLVGIALGALIFGAIRPRLRSPLPLIAAAQIATAVLVVLGSRVIASSSAPFQSESWFLDFALSTAIVVLPPTIVLGITFPATSALLKDQLGAEGGESGSLLFTNTAGSIAATFLMPFLVIPLIGSPATLALLAIVNAIIGTLLFASFRQAGADRRVAGIAAGIATAAAVLLAFVTSAAFRQPTIEAIEGHGGVVFEATEDEIAAVQAGDLGGRRLWVGGTSMTALTVDTKFMPLLPIMLRPDTDRGLVIAFGMGTSFRTSLAAGVTTDAVELVPSVVDMFHWFYADGDEVLEDPLGRVIVADGRNHVELTEETYDFVVVDPPPPIESSGVSVISSLEFYEAAKSRLNPAGVMMQWVPYGQSLDDFLAHVRTFLYVFPNVRVMAGPGGNGFFMLGSDGPVDLDPATMTEVLSRPGILEDVNDAPDAGGLTADEWVNRLLELDIDSGAHLRAGVGNGPLITDDRPLPEYFLLRRRADPDAVPLTFGSLKAHLQVP